MSNSLAIAAVTATLQRMLSESITAGLPASAMTSFNLGNTKITAKPPDKARGPSDNFNQINLFLYQATPDAALRNMDMPRQIAQGEKAPPPVALTLHYLVTAIGQDDDDTRAHILLGQAMRIFHDRAVLSPAEIRDALADNDLYAQIERVRLTPQPLSLEELSKLWATFQTQFRISAAYQVSAILIESSRPARAPLPVLTRGPGDIGAIVQPSLLPPVPLLDELRLPNGQTAARLGDQLTLRGHHLGGAGATVRFTHPLLAQPVELAAAGAIASELTVTLPDDPASWPAGFYTVAAVIPQTGAGPARISNALALALAPRIATALPASVSRNASGDAVLSLACQPTVRPEQRAALLLGDREILAAPRPAPADRLTFEITDAPAGEHLVRLRVDGVDSLLVDRGATPPIFDASQKVTIA